MVGETSAIGANNDTGTSALTQDTAAHMVAEARTGGQFDAQGLASQLSGLDTATAEALSPQIEAHLTPVERGELARAQDAANDNRGAAPPDPVKLGFDLGQMALDLTGIVDPTPISDGLNAIISLGRSAGSALSGDWSEAGGHLTNAGISVAGIAVGLGDLAKVGKVGKWAETVSDTVSAIAHNPALRETLEPALREAKNALDAIPQGALDKLPASARESLEATKKQLDDYFGAGAKQVQVPGGGLAAHEAAGGHLIEKHVGKSETELQARLQAEPRISGSSSFPNVNTAERVVSETLSANQAKIDNWLSGNGNRLVLDHTTNGTTGISVSRGAAGAEDVHSARVVLTRDPAMSTGYRIITGYPTKP